MYITIITVCYNCENDIEITLKSILKQTLKKYELIIIDGDSKDKTKKIIKEFIPLFEIENVKVSFISEKDRGIYDAMNKGIRLAENQYINFMNAGDIYYNEFVLENIENYLKEEKYEIIYGKVNKKYNDKEIIQNPGNIKNLYKGSMFCHQSSFIKSELLKENEYSLEYKIISDFEFFYKMYLSNKMFKEIPEIISTYDTTGLSSNPKNTYQLILEYKKCILENNLNIKNYFHWNKRYLKQLVFKYFKKK